MKDEGVDDGIVFYSEGKAYAPYLHPIINALAGLYEKHIYYITSDCFDPMYMEPPERVKAYFIGKGGMRTYVFSKMRARILAMTMPDLNTFHIKRSPGVDHYTYFHHSLVSTHMVYRKGAFDHFDSIMCVGKYHKAEILEQENLAGLPPKKLFRHGSPPLDTLMAIAERSPPRVNNQKKLLNILLAPSWGPTGIIETCASEIVEILLKNGHFVKIRPHPRTRQLSSKVLSKLFLKFSTDPNFEMNEDISQHEDLIQADVLISDWSGVAMEFAFGLERPVLFIDVPRKINNTEYENLKIEPLEVSYRQTVGMVMAPDEIHLLPAFLSNLLLKAEQKRTAMLHLRQKLFYNLGNSAEIGAKTLVKIADGINKASVSEI